MFDVHSLIESGGLLLIALIVFAESGMFVGFFFPGDSLLVSAGIFAATGTLNIYTLIPIIALAAILGDNIGYHIGQRYGRKLFKKSDSVVFRQEYLTQAEKFYGKYGSRAMLFAHFVPIVRTFAPPAAGISNMNYKQFFVYDAIGDIVWATSVTLVGYWVGSRIPNIDKYMEFVIIGVVVIVLGPTLYHIAKAFYQKRRNAPEVE